MLTWDTLLDGYDPFTDYQTFYGEVFTMIKDSNITFSFFSNLFSNFEYVMEFVLSAVFFLLFVQVCFIFAKVLIVPILKLAARW